MEKVASVMELLDSYSSEDDCVRALYEVRTEEGWTCPECGCESHRLLLPRRKIQCSRCSHQEAVTAGTPMYRSHVALRGWFLAMYLVANDKRGVSASRLSSELKVTWNTAYYLLQRVRSMMAQRGSVQRA